MKPLFVFLLIACSLPGAWGGTNSNVTVCASAVLTVDITQQPICPGVSEGEVFVAVVASNAADYVLLWDPVIDPATQIPGGQAAWDQRAIRLGEGQYTVTASNRVEGCTFSTNVTVTARNPALIFDVIPDFNCVLPGQTTCARLANILGGIDPDLEGTSIVADWNVNGTVFTGPFICGLGPGTYEVTVSGLEPANGNVSTVCSKTRPFQINPCGSAAPVMDCVDVVLACVGSDVPRPTVTDDNDPSPLVEVVGVTERFEPDFCRVLEVEYRATDLDGARSFCTRMVRYLDSLPPTRVRFEEAFPEQFVACPGAITTHLALFRQDLTDNCALRLEAPASSDCALSNPLDGTADWTRGVYDNRDGTPLAAPSRLWECQSSITNTDGIALQAGGFTTAPLLGDNETTFLETVVTGPGTLCFEYRLSSERQLLSTSTADFFRFLVGTNVVVERAGEVAWNQVCHAVPAGPVVLRWEYARDDFLSVGEDGAWIDKVTFQTSNPPPAVRVESIVRSGSGCGPDRQRVDLLYIAEDSCGNEGRFTQTWSVADSVAPEAPGFASEFPDRVVGSLAEVTTNLPGFRRLVSDTCGVMTTEVLQAASPVGCADSVRTLVYRAFDDCGNERRFTQTWSVARSLPDFDAVPSPVAIDCSDPFPEPPVVTGTDADGKALVARSSLRPFQTNCSGRVEFERVYTLVGGCGLVATASQPIQFKADTEPPEIGLPGLPPPLDGGSTCQVTMSDLGAFAVDRCGGPLPVVQSPVAGTVLAGARLLPVTLTAEDGCGNRATVTIAVQVVCDEPANGGVFGVVWQDLEGDASPVGDDLNQFGVSGVTMQLFRIQNGSTSLLRTTRTVAAGGYAFGNLSAGTYMVRPDPAGIPSGAGVPAISNQTFTIAGQSEEAHFPLVPAPGPQIQTVLATVWNDLSADGNPNNENLSATGLPGIRLRVTDVDGSTPPQQYPTGSNGTAALELLVGNRYEITVEPADIPSFLNRRSTPTLYLVRAGAALPDLLFGVHRTADAVTLASVGLEDLPPALTWTTSYEENTLGFYVYQDVGGGQWVRAHSNLVLATGGGDYAVAVPNGQGPYSLREWTADMQELVLAELGLGYVILNPANLISPPPAQLAGHVAADADLDGVISVEERAAQGFANVRVHLFAVAADGGETPSQTATSGTDGAFAFTRLRPGTYRAAVELADLPDGLEGQSTPVSRVFTLAPGQSVDDADFGFFPASRPVVFVKVIAWNDLTADGRLENENPSATRLSGIRIGVSAIGFNDPALPAAGFVTDTDGCAHITLVPGAAYEIRLDEGSVPEAFDLRSTPVVYRISAEPDMLRFGVHQTADAVGLESLAVGPDAVEWTIAWEHEVIGYRLYRRDRKAGWTPVHDRLVLARGGGRYQIPVSEPGGVFSLREVTTHVVENEVARFADASPLGEPVKVLGATMAARAADGFVIPEHARSLLVEGVTVGWAEDITDPDAPTLLLGELLVTPHGRALYFSWPAGRRVRVR